MDFAILVSSISGNETLNRNIHKYVKVVASNLNGVWYANENGD
jgi:hypothetical protein